MPSSLVQFALLVATLTILGTASARAQTAEPKRESVSFPHTADGFRQQHGQILAAFKRRDAQQARAIIATFRLPDPSLWFSQNFEAGKVPELVTRYDETVREFQTAIEKRLQELARLKNYEIEITARQGDPKLPTRPIEGFKPGVFVPTHELQFDRFRFAQKVDGVVSYSWEDTFVYVDGAHRYIGGGAFPFWEWEKTRHPIPGLVHPAKLIKQVPPAYPAVAKARGIEGVVRLKAVITKEGGVRDIEVISGDPALTQAAVEAVKKWRYEPQRINGQPIEIDTTIDILFQLRNR